jgi:NTE family protein
MRSFLLKIREKGRCLFLACHLALLLLLLFFLFAIPSGADEQAPGKRPRIGLVLSGGGARGIAHIGVLKVLEDMRVPIDCITGTSMGAIVGGLYAAGASPAELAELVTSMSWNEAFKDKPSTDQLSFRRKEDNQNYRIDLNLGYREGKLTTAKGFVQGQNLNLLLKKLLIHTANIHNFDQLHIPFRAVAADIETGEAVVLGTGDIAGAIRASMSIPGFFAPAEIDGRMLVDGGIANNLPMNVAREMGADILIVVDIGTPLRTKEKLSSMAGITAQVMTILIQRNVAAQLHTLKVDDILIQPDLGDIGTTDFSQTKKALAIGRDAAEKIKDRIAHLSVSADDYKNYLVLQRQTSQELPVIDYVRVEKHQAKLSPNVLTARVQMQPGERLDLKKLDEDMIGLYGLDTFERVNFHLEEKDKKTGLVYEPVEKSWGPTYVRFAISWADNFKGESTYTMGASITQTQLNALGAEWRNQFQLGDRPRLFSEFYQPLDFAGRYFIAPQVSYEERNVNQYQLGGKGDVTAQYRIKEVMTGIDIGREFGNWGQLRMGLRRGYGVTRINIGDPSLDSGSYNIGGLYTAFFYDTLDDFNFPTRGSTGDIAVLATLQELGSDVKANSLSVNWLTAKTWDKYTFLPSFSYAGAFGGDSQIQGLQSIGGFFNLSGYMPDELSGQYTGLARLICYRNMGFYGLGEINAQLYLGFSLEAGNAWQNRSDITAGSLIYAGSIFVGASTFIGPVYLIYGMAEGGHQALGLLIGQRF